MQAALCYGLRPVAASRQQGAKRGYIGAVLPVGPGLTAGRAQLLAAKALGSDKGDKKVLTREDEPDEYWASAREKEGKSPWTDPLAIIGLLAIFFPLILLGVFAALGYVDLSGGR
ncbi:hypothetical protein N2152v2_008251 [Parachlorella kessleri]